MKKKLCCFRGKNVTDLAYMTVLFLCSLAVNKACFQLDTGLASDADLCLCVCMCKRETWM